MEQHEPILFPKGPLGGLDYLYHPHLGAIALEQWHFQDIGRTSGMLSQGRIALPQRVELDLQRALVMRVLLS
jgi:hypothetical protein